MKEKTLAIIICILIVLSILGFGYAQWNDTITVAGTLQFGYWNSISINMGFVDPLKYSDNEATKDVGQANCYYTNHKIDPETSMEAYNTTIITISNGYPGYEVKCNLTLKNIGTQTLHINKTVISDPTGTLTWNSTLNALVNVEGKPILNINIKPNIVCNNLESGDTLEAEIDIQITQNSEECHTYYFQIEIAYEEAKP